MTTEGRDRDAPDEPSTRAAAEAGAGAAAGASPTDKLGASPGSVSIEGKSGQERLRRSQDAAVTAAEHDAFWRRSFASRPYTRKDRDYEHYRPAYQFGWEARERHGERRFEDVEPRLREQWDPQRMLMEWDEARPAVRDAYDRRSNTDTATPGNPLA